MTDAQVPAAAAAASGSLAPWKAEFLQHCLDGGVLRFGSFTLNSKRVSPYFFNAGLFHRADLLRSISTAYAQTIAAYLAAESDESSSTTSTGQRSTAIPALEFDVLFGPAYKGIPLATATTEKLATLDVERFGQLSYAFNRKEPKDHGEGGTIVGCPLKGKRVLVIDDVITAGTAIREAIDIIAREGGSLVGVVVALDRMEKVAKPGDDDDPAPRPSAVGQVQKQYGIPVLSILTLDDIIHGLSDAHAHAPEDMARLTAYRERYRADA